jgi:hypothetical protein
MMSEWGMQAFKATFSVDRRLQWTATDANIVLIEGKKFLENLIQRRLVITITQIRLFNFRTTTG